MTAPDSFRMTPSERRASFSLAGLFMCRMLGLFLLLPVFAVAAQGLPGGNDPARVGLALGMYGLTQAFMQIPFGIASDKWGRRPVVVFGLLLFVLGSIVCALSDDLFWITLGRAIQGSGAISAAVTAWLADATRDHVRTKAMAMIGVSIGITFAISLVLAPLLVGWGGLPGLFWTIAALGVAALAVAAWIVPAAPPTPPSTGKIPFRTVLLNPDLLRLNLGVFTLHLIQVALFVVVPATLVRIGGLEASTLWRVYLPVIVVSFLVMVPIIGVTERFSTHRQTMRGAVGALLLVCIGLVWAQAHYVALVIALTAFFSVFNVLEAMQPSLVSRVAPPTVKGLALGFYNTSQAAGLFAGGALGGYLSLHASSSAVYVLAAVLAVIWLIATWRLTPLPPRRTARQAAAS
ncbi:MFS transporter [Pigmentiphaga litoralis]|uniref:MFS family permease n=1 Tax=Pigmentiphaga litoralis TaxID=516702 RepID=A0A7Y9ITI9_9BURK|nr:MFS transporter [Pigmentiphaga litoralis]NYE24362.1 MFS family permease [Pigmentiphaga litoralis]NYE82024.1 MFS family permease [Pigmentiphaga litoralis]